MSVRGRRHLDLWKGVVRVPIHETITALVVAALSANSAATIRFLADLFVRLRRRVRRHERK